MDFHFSHIGFFSMNEKHGLGIKIFKNKNLILIAHWINDTIDGLTIYITSNSNEEKILFCNKDKTNNEIVSEKEIKKIKESQIYRDMKDFYSNIKD